MFEAHDSQTIFDAIDNTSTTQVVIILKIFLKHQTDLTELRERQRVCKAMLSEKKTFTEITGVLESLAKHEKGILWALKSKTNEERRIIDSVYFQNRFLKQFNFNENFMTFYNYFKIMFAPHFTVFFLQLFSLYFHLFILNTLMVLI